METKNYLSSLLDELARLEAAASEDYLSSPDLAQREQELLAQQEYIRNWAKSGADPDKLGFEAIERLRGELRWRTQTVRQLQHDKHDAAARLARLRAAQAALDLAERLLADIGKEYAEPIRGLKLEIGTEVKSWRKEGRGWFEDRKVGAYGPYRYFRWRGEDGKLKTHYLGKIRENEKETAEAGAGQTETAHPGFVAKNFWLLVYDSASEETTAHGPLSAESANQLAAQLAAPNRIYQADSESVAQSLHLAWLFEITRRGHFQLWLDKQVQS